ncbi:hypothetical protein ACLOJK_038743 [Asimina triloba]
MHRIAGAPDSVLHHPPQAGSHGCRRWVFRRNLLQIIRVVHHVVQVQIHSSPADPDASTTRHKRRPPIRPPIRPSPASISHAPRPPARSGRPPPRAAQVGDTNEHLARTHHAQIMMAAPIFPIFISHRQSNPIQPPSMVDSTQDPMAGVFRRTIRLHQQLPVLAPAHDPSPSTRQPVDGETATASDPKSIHPSARSCARPCPRSISIQQQRSHEMGRIHLNSIRHPPRPRSTHHPHKLICIPSIRTPQPRSYEPARHKPTSSSIRPPRLLRPSRPSAATMAPRSNRP